MEAIDQDNFKFAINKIDDGKIFEEFGLSFMGNVLGYEFMPIGGTKDKGIDGLQHIFTRKGFQKVIYQLSTEKDFEEKIKLSIEKLQNNKILFDNFTYVTNRHITNEDQIIDGIYEKYKVTIRIFDQNWFTKYSNHSQATIGTYYTFIDSYLYEFSKPGKTTIVRNLDKDCRLFVFLRQQLETTREDLKIDDLLSDTLILYGLEGTDPDKKIFKTKDELFSIIRGFIRFDPKLLNNTIDKRLKVLSTKPRKINHHPDINAYCLPYSTRIEITNKNLKDEKLYEDFNTQAVAKLKKYLKDYDVIIKDAFDLINNTIHKIFYEQGLEFADFMLGGNDANIVEKDLQDIISKTVDESIVINKNKEAVKTALLMSIRDMVYNGTLEQHQYFKSLSNTYMMMFLLQWDPNISLYFETLASKLNVYVCTSIIIPALSEIFLEPENQRHTNLLKGAWKSGVRLVINETILKELCGHFEKIRKRYQTYYENNEDIYLADEIQTTYINEVMIRAYFYSKSRNKIDNFDNFIDNFTNPDLSNTSEDLIVYLEDNFGIKYVSDESLNIKIDKDEYNALSSALEQTKDNKQKAEIDAKLMLTIYALRKKNNEKGNGSIFGYRTWWLSKDVKTYQAIKDLFGEKYNVSCYLRADFLYNYISLAPKSKEIDETYKGLFPSLLGINLSFHLPKEVKRYVRDKINEYNSKAPHRLKQIMRELSEKLKTDVRNINRKNLEHYFDEIDKELGMK